VKRVVAPWLPMEDPANEARRIVRRGMSDIICSFSDEVWGNWQRESPRVEWGDPWVANAGLPMVDVVVGKHVTFVSAQVDAECRHMERVIAELQAKWAYDMKVINTYGAWPRRHILGLVDPL
jgi:hypothetical protein